MDRRIAALVSLLVVLGLLLAACGPTAEPAAPPSPTEAPTEAAAAQPTEVAATEVPAAQPTEVVATEAPAATEPAPTEAAPVSEIKRGGVLTIGFEADFLNLDPAFQEAWVDMVPPDMAYDTLLKWDPATLEPQPRLAKSWEVSEDGLTWTFQLQEGVKFHDGTPLTAEDVKFSFDRILAPDSGSTIAPKLDAVESVTVVDEGSIALKLKYPFSPLLDTLSDVPSIMSQAFVEAAGGTTPRAMMGTGPFKFVEWIPDQVLRFEKNPDYWRMGEDGQPLPYLDGLEFIPQADETARLADFLAGVTDFMDLVPDKDVATLLENPDIQMFGPQTMWYSYVAFDNTQPPFDNKLVRQAISWAIDRDEIVKTGLFGRGTPMYRGAIPDWHWAANDLKVYDHQDMDKAKALLAEAGFPDAQGFPEVTIYTGQPYQSEITTAEMSAAYLQELGINAKVEVQEWGTFIDGLMGGKFTMWSTGESPLGDPDSIYYNGYSSKGSFNFWKYNSPEVDDLLTQGRVATDPAERTEIYRKLEERLLDDTPLALVFFHEVWLAAHPQVHGFVKPANDRYFSLTDIWLDE